MANFLAELKRRHIYRVAAAYAVMAWLLLQLFNNLTPIMELPDWAGTLVLVLLIGGFPIALLFAWIFQVASAPETSDPRPTATRLDYVLAGALVVVIALVSYQQLSPTTGATTAQQVSIAPGTAVAGGISIAVLPFANLSGDASQEFFSDGMTEEITTALAKVPNLRVVGRTSAFQFKGQTRDFAAIRQALGVAYLIDGSVRKEGDRVRITAQLVQADSGSNVWTESYDRQLTSVFATQEDIARAIAGALRVPLGLGQGQTLVANRMIDLDSYQQYLRARALFRARDLGQAITLLESIIARDPNYAPAWALLASAQRLTPNRQPRWFTLSVEERREIVQSSRDKAERAARAAIGLDPKLPAAIAAQAAVDGVDGRWVIAEELYRRALAIDPSDPDILDSFSQSLRFVGRLNESLQLREQLRALEPFVPSYNIQTAATMQGIGQNKPAIEILDTTPADVGDELLNRMRAITFARAYAELGRYGEAADALLAMRSSQFSRSSVEAAARLLRSAPATARVPSELPALEGELEFVYIHVGAPERVLDNYERALGSGFRGNYPSYWSPVFAPLRKSERFRAHLRRSGVIDIWRASHWPDLCRPVGTDDFVCE